VTIADTYVYILYHIFICLYHYCFILSDFRFRSDFMKFVLYFKNVIHLIVSDVFFYSCVPLLQRHVRRLNVNKEVSDASPLLNEVSGS